MIKKIGNELKFKIDFKTHEIQKSDHKLDAKANND